MTRWNDRCVLRETTALITAMLTAYSTDAQTATFARIDVAEAPPIGTISAPATAAAIAYAEALYATRVGGRRSNSCVIAGAAQTTSTPAAQPKRTIVETPNRNEGDQREQGADPDLPPLHCRNLLFSGWTRGFFRLGDPRPSPIRVFGHMEVEVTPEPGDDEREVIVEALRRVVGEPGYVNSAWRS